MLPNFLIIGANKGGTTSLHRYLSAHPEIFMSTPKEPTYFALDGAVTSEPRPFLQDMIVTREAYEALFDAVDGEKAVGEASTAYLRSTPAARRIHEAIPDAKLIAVLRDPSDRARSAHAMYVQRGYEDLKRFDDAVEEELSSPTSSRRFVKGGFYYEGLSTYYDLFGADQMKVFLFEDLTSDPLAVVREIYEWLGVDPTFTPDVTRQYNVTTLPKSRLVERAMEDGAPTKTALRRVLPAPARGWVKDRAKTWNRTKAPPLTDDTRRRLVALYEDDIRGVESLIGRDLSAWRQV